MRSSHNVEPIRDFSEPLNTVSEVTIYVTGSSRGAGRSARGLHGFGVVVTVDGIWARSRAHASASDNTTFHRGCLGGAITALEWANKNVRHNRIRMCSKIPYLWKNAKYRLYNWAISGRIDNEEDDNCVANWELWSEIYQYGSYLQLTQENWSGLEGPRDREFYRHAQRIARQAALSKKNRILKKQSLREQNEDSFEENNWKLFTPVRFKKPVHPALKDRLFNHSVFY